MKVKLKKKKSVMDYNLLNEIHRRNHISDTFSLYGIKLIESHHLYSNEQANSLYWEERI